MSKRKRLLRNFLLLLLPIALVWFGFCAWVTNGFLHPGRYPLTQSVSQLPVPAKEVTFPSRGDSLALRGWLIPAEGVAKGAVILCHGRSDNREMMLPQAEFLRKAGFTCLVFDFRCSGESAGDTSTIGWQETNDVLGAVDYLKSRPDTKDLPLGALGISMGGAAVLMAAVKSPEIQVVVADCPYAILTRAIDQRFRAFLGVFHPVMSFPVRFWGERFSGLNSDNVAPLQAVKQLAGRPLLLIHGTQDITILPEDSELLYRAASEPKEIWRVEGARHARNYSHSPDEYTQRVTKHFQHLPRK
jgi:fermentation-respiration switch protein FrsA (DUF1100 family)